MILPTLLGQKEAELTQALRMLRVADVLGGGSSGWHARESHSGSSAGRDHGFVTALRGIDDS